MNTVPCPHCGADIRADATFCRHCGSSDSDGWREDWAGDDEGEDFDYDSFVEEHFSDRLASTTLAPLWRLVVLLLLLSFVVWILLLYW